MNMTHAHIRLLCEIKDDPGKRYESLSATRLKLVVAMVAAGLVEEKNFLKITEKGERILNVLAAELTNFVSRG